MEDPYSNGSQSSSGSSSSSSGTHRFQESLNAMSASKHYTRCQDLANQSFKCIETHPNDRDKCQGLNTFFFFFLQL
jgi:hypothetical protein